MGRRVRYDTPPRPRKWPLTAIVAAHPDHIAVGREPAALENADEKAGLDLRVVSKRARITPGIQPGAW